MRHGKVLIFIQVSYELTQDNLDREINGAMEAMIFFSLKTATLVTFSGKDEFKKNGCTIVVVPAHEFLIENE